MEKLGSPFGHWAGHTRSGLLLALVDGLPEEFQRIGAPLVPINLFPQLFNLFLDFGALLVGRPVEHSLEGPAVLVQRPVGFVVRLIGGPQIPLSTSECRSRIIANLLEAGQFLLVLRIQPQNLDRQSRKAFASVQIRAPVRSEFGKLALVINRLPSEVFPFCFESGSALLRTSQV